MLLRSSVVFAQRELLPALLCFGAAFLLDLTVLFQRVDNLSYDLLTKVRADLKPVKSAAALALIGIDEPSLRDPELGIWPWNREIHGDFMQLLGLQRPSVVAWDIMFPEPSEADAHFTKGMVMSRATVVLGATTVAGDDEGVRPGDDAAKQSRLKPLKNVVGDRTRILHGPAMLLPAGSLSQVAEIGFVDTPPDSDGVRRLAPLVVRVGDDVYPSLSLRSLMEYWKATDDQVEVRLGDAIVIDAPLAQRRIPIDRTGAYRINYRHALRGFEVHGYGVIRSGLLLRHVEKKTDVALPPLTGRILLLGQVADGLTDFGPTPFSPLTPLVLVHGNVIENVLAEDYVRWVPPWTLWLGAFGFGLIGLIRFSDRKLHEQAVYSLGMPVAYGMVAAVAWMHGSWLMPVIGPVFGFAALQIFMVGRRVLAEQRAKEQIKGMFGAYLSPQLISRMVDSGQMPKLGGHEEEITAYFSDIQGYSTFSEKLEPHRLVELLNEYLTACTDILQEEGGSLDKYIGDAVVAMYGAPVALKDHAYRACLSAVRVQDKLDELRARWDAQGDRWPDGVRKMRSRIGLNSGSAIIGNMGSRTRFNYTMTGDNVNLAARMESGAKAWGTYIMTTEATKVACEAQGGDRVVFRPLGRVVVKGRTLGVPIYEVVGLKEKLLPATRECVELFSAGLEKYYAEDWDGALALFEQSARLELNIPGKAPGVSNNPSLVYQEIVAHFKLEPPAPNWGGVYTMKEK